MSAFNSTISAINEAKKFVESRGAKLLVVLQPNLFVSKTKSDYEKSVRSRWSSFMMGQVMVCYPKYEVFVDQCDFGVSMTNIFDYLEHSVYLDWCHVNARGAEIIANSLHRELVRLKYV
jgi:endonuclease IV